MSNLRIQKSVYNFPVFAVRLQTWFSQHYIRLHQDAQEYTFFKTGQGMPNPSKITSGRAF